MKKWFIATYVMLTVTFALPGLIASGSDHLVSPNVDELWWAMSIGGVWPLAMLIMAPFQGDTSAIGTGVYLACVALNLWPVGVLAVDPRRGKTQSFWILTCLWILLVLYGGLWLSAAMHI